MSHCFWNIMFFWRSSVAPFFIWMDTLHLRKDTQTPQEAYKSTGTDTMHAVRIQNTPGRIQTVAHEKSNRVPRTRAKMGSKTSSWPDFRTNLVSPTKKCHTYCSFEHFPFCCKTCFACPLAWHSETNVDLFWVPLGRSLANFAPLGSKLDPNCFHLGPNLAPT